LIDYSALFSFLTILLPDRRLLRLMVASLSSLGLSHVLAVFRFAVPFAAFFVEHFGGGVYPHLAATAPGACAIVEGSTPSALAFLVVVLSVLEVSSPFAGAVACATHSDAAKTSDTTRTNSFIFGILPCSSSQPRILNYARGSTLTFRIGGILHP
jgi:hypothetical protein